MAGKAVTSIMALMTDENDVSRMKLSPHSQYVCCVILLDCAQQKSEYVSYFTIVESRSMSLAKLTWRKTPLQSRSRQRVEKILSAALDLLMQQGLASVTTSRVAAAAGVPVGSVYQFFPNRDAILLALHERLEDKEDAAIEHALQSAQHMTDIGDIARAVLSAFTAMNLQVEERDALSAALASLPEWQENRRQSTKRIAAAISQHPLFLSLIPDADLRARRADILVTMGMAVIPLMRDQPDETARTAIMEEMVQAISAYLQAMEDAG